MVVSFEFFVPFILMALLYLAVWIESDFLGKVIALGMMAFGVYVLVSGLENIPSSDLLVMSIGIISVSLGFYVFMKDYLEEFAVTIGR